jgi:hypothetical protein
MKAKVAMLIVGAALGSAGTAFGVTTLGRYEVPRGYAGTFQGMPKVACLNKGDRRSARRVPKGRVGVVCFVKSGGRNDWAVVIEWNRLTVFNPSGRVILRARL